MTTANRERAMLRDSFLFREVSEDALDWALAQSRREGATKGEVLYTAHRFERSLGFVLSGKVRVTRGDLLVSVLEPGMCFGAAALFNQRQEYPTTLTAMTDCAVLFLSQETVAELMERWPRVGVNYVHYLSGRICFLSDRLNSLAAGSAEEKVEQFLRRGADADGVVCVAATAVARALGLGRASVYRAFETLEERGVLKREHKKFVLLSNEVEEPT